MKKIDKEEKTVAGATASGLLKSICNFKFIFILNSLNRLFGQINKLNESLQNSKIDIIKAREIAFATIDDLKKNNLPEIFKIIYEKSISMAKENSIDSPAEVEELAFNSNNNNNKKRYLIFI